LANFFFTVRHPPNEDGVALRESEGEGRKSAKDPVSAEIGGSVVLEANEIRVRKSNSERLHDGSVLLGPPEEKK